jgi:hypothetical protein
LLRGLGVNNIRITVMMGTGLMAMPTAKGSICKTTSHIKKDVKIIPKRG